jgi:hypothetical protein
MQNKRTYSHHICGEYYQLSFTFVKQSKKMMQKHLLQVILTKQDIWIPKENVFNLGFTNLLRLVIQINGVLT